MKLPSLSSEELLAFSAHCVSPRHCLFRVVLVVEKCSGWCAAGTCNGDGTPDSSPSGIKGLWWVWCPGTMSSLCCLLHSLVEDLKWSGGYCKSKYGKHRGFQHCNAAIRSFLNSAAPQRFNFTYWSSCLRSVPAPLQETMLVLLFQQKIPPASLKLELNKSSFKLLYIASSPGISRKFISISALLCQQPGTAAASQGEVWSLHSHQQHSQHHKMVLCHNRQGGKSNRPLHCSAQVTSTIHSTSLSVGFVWATQSPTQRGWDRFHYEALSI